MTPGSETLNHIHYHYHLHHHHHYHHQHHSHPDKHLSAPQGLHDDPDEHHPTKYRPPGPGDKVRKLTTPGS